MTEKADTIARNKAPAAGGAAPPRRVLYIDHTAALGGGEIALLNLVRYLDARRYVPIVLLMQDGPLRARLVGQAGVETHVLRLSPSVLNARKDSLGFNSFMRMADMGRTLISIFKVARFIQAAHVDLIHTNSLKSDIIGGLAARLCGKPVVWHVRDRIDADYLPASVVWMFRFLCKFVPNSVIANSGATLNTLRRRSRGSSAIPSGVDVDMLPPTVMEMRGQELLGRRAGARVVHDGTISTPDSLKARAFPAPSAIEVTPGIATGEPRITLVGRVARWKGQHIFLQAAAWTLRHFPKARFEIVGAPLFDERDYEEEIHALARRLGIGNSVAFLGFRSDIPEYLAGIDLLVHASITGEPFGQVIIEAMAAGKPVVATNGGGVPEIVEHGESGLLVPMGDAGAMAEAICRILKDPEAAAEMGQRGRQCVAERFTVNHTASKVQTVYDDLLEARK